MFFIFMPFLCSFLPWANDFSFIFYVQVYIRKCTLITPHPLVLLSTEMVVAPPEGASEDIMVEPNTVGEDILSDDDVGSAEDEGEVRSCLMPLNQLSVHLN